MDECDTITAFVRVLAHRTGNPTLVVDRWPDKEPRTGPITEPEIDAVAGKFAIEHTSIDSVTDQRERNASFLDVVRGLDSLIKEHVGCGFTVTLEFDAIGKGKWTGNAYVTISRSGLGNEHRCSKTATMR